MTQEQLRWELETRKEVLTEHLHGLRSELTLADVTVGGRPILDYVREQPLLAVGVAVGGAALAGLLLTLLRRETPASPAPRDEFWRHYMDDLIDAAAFRVQRGEDTDTALQKALRQRAPVVYVENEVDPKAPSTVLRSTFDLLFKTALGFGTKFALDRMAQALTGEEEIVEAVKHPHHHEPGQVVEERVIVETPVS